MKYRVFKRFFNTFLMMAALSFAFCAQAYGQAGGGPGGGGQAAGGQGRGGGAPAPPPTAKALAPFDLSGYWVSVVTEDWRYRMVPPAKGDYQAVPMNPEGLKLANAWDSAKDEAAGNQCMYYGAAALMRIPGNVHITWQDDNTLKIETDAGTQTRILHFGNWKSPGGERSWQGDTVATWDVPRSGRGPAPVPAPYGALKTVTTNLKAGYLRKNGVPYSENAVLTEYYDVIRGVDGNPWLVITGMVDDPQYLRMTFITSSNFKKVADGSGWDPSPCSARW
jgi:hypothetical protein